MFKITPISQIAQKEIAGQASNEVKNTNVSHSERKENLFAFPSQRNVNEDNCTNDTNEIPHHVRNEVAKTIWWCWLQGIEAAPAIVKACYNSLKTAYGLPLSSNRQHELEGVCGVAGVYRGEMGKGTDTGGDVLGFAEGGTADKVWGNVD